MPLVTFIHDKRIAAHEKKSHKYKTTFEILLSE